MANPTSPPRRYFSVMWQEGRIETNRTVDEVTSANSNLEYSHIPMPYLDTRNMICLQQLKFLCKIQRLFDIDWIKFVFTKL